MLRVLVVDDETLVCETIADSLQEFHSASAVRCTTAEAAREAMASMRFDAALIDVVLSDASGFAVAELAVALNIPCIMITGYAEAIRQCQEHGIPCLEKPFLSSILSEVIPKLTQAPIENIARARVALAGVRRRA